MIKMRRLRTPEVAATKTRSEPYAHRHIQTEDGKKLTNFQPNRSDESRRARKEIAVKLS
jgi:hypothetical protein